ncbi:type II toxin-antitoxin system PemK/MazF family toxin [Chamaesiphon sp.]|uniref:type II toxin-antitoxin system PemK/MazF family toxin n=1 Tax=Chamaesiphon sp. TaxID=2814140 RepID=UPI0035945B0B
MATSHNYRLGSIWLVNFDPQIGNKIRQPRPVMIVSGTLFNQRRKVTILPIISDAPDNRLLPVVVPIEPNPTNGLTTDSLIICVDPMTFNKQRLVQQLGRLSTDKIRQVQSILCSYLELDAMDRDLDDSSDLLN